MSIKIDLNDKANKTEDKTILNKQKKPESDDFSFKNIYDSSSYINKIKQRIKNVDIEVGQVCEGDIDKYCNTMEKASEKKFANNPHIKMSPKALEKMYTNPGFAEKMMSDIEYVINPRNYNDDNSNIVCRIYIGSDGQIQTVVSGLKDKENDTKNNRNHNTKIVNKTRIKNRIIKRYILEKRRLRRLESNKNYDPISFNRDLFNNALLLGRKNQI
ncbi:MAG: hypothetical protein PUE01_12115 [Clostridiaceae bacterium]|nr:hypothetical protein [Clostridiaceae bacterium]